MEAEGTLVVAQKWGVTAHGYGAVWADGNVLKWLRISGNIRKTTRSGCVLWCVN